MEPEMCSECLAQRPAYNALRSWGVYGGALRKAVIRLKYGRDMGMGESLSKHLIELYNDVGWEIDLVIPVPLSRARFKKRGYNQAGLLALPLAYALGKPYQSTALERVRDTASQVQLDAHERRKNVENAFRAQSKWVNGKSILVIDDVTTTGSTIGACARALSEAGASAVFGMTLARSILQADADDQPT
jgi:competence protein ComFC